MKIKFVYLLAVCFLLSMCKSKEERKDLPLSRSQFKHILGEVLLAEAILDNKTIRSDSLHVSIQPMYDSLFKANGITERDFFETYDSYIDQNPVVLDTIYTEIIDEFTIKRDSLKHVNVKQLELDREGIKLDKKQFERQRISVGEKDKKDN